MAWTNYNKNNKYKAQKVEIDGIIFDSKREGKRYQELKLLEQAGIISSLELQKKYILIPSQRDKDIITKTGKHKPGKVLERECSYYADFVYYNEETKEWVVEDTKGVKTKEYLIKRKLMLYIHGIRIQEV